MGREKFKTYIVAGESIFPKCGIRERKRGFLNGIDDKSNNIRANCHACSDDNLSASTEIFKYCMAINNTVSLFRVIVGPRWRVGYNSSFFSYFSRQLYICIHECHQIFILVKSKIYPKLNISFFSVCIC